MHNVAELDNHFQNRQSRFPLHNPNGKETMSSLQPLTSFPSGSRVTVQQYSGGTKARCRLCALGLTPGTQVEVRSVGPGPCRINVRGSDLILGRGLAEKVLATPLS